jgi:hypothetical protein
MYVVRHQWTLPSVSLGIKTWQCKLTQCQNCSRLDYNHETEGKYSPINHKINGDALRELKIEAVLDIDRMPRNKHLDFKLTRIDDMDLCWVNGTGIGPVPWRFSTLRVFVFVTPLNYYVAVGSHWLRSGSPPEVSPLVRADEGWE